MHCDHAFWVGGTAENFEDIPELERLPGAAGIKVFMGSSTGDLLVPDDEGVRAHPRAHAPARRLPCRRTSSACASGSASAAPGDPSSHPVWRDAEAALSATRRLVAIARETGALIHVLHVSTAEEMRFLAAHKDIASVEVTPHHLTFSADDYARLGTLLQMNPPVRDAAHRAGDLGGRRRRHRGHSRLRPRAAYAARRRRGPIRNRPPACPACRRWCRSCSTMWRRAGCRLLRFMDMTSAGPARLFGIAGKGRIAVGYDADFTIVDLKRQRDDRQRLDRLALRLDALCRHERHRLAGRHDRPRPARHVGGRAARAPARAGRSASTRRSVTKPDGSITLP